MIKCTQYKSLNSGCLVGIFNVFVENWCLNIYGCKLFQKDGSRWISFPSQEREVDGEKKYFQFISFKNPRHQKKFSQECVEAIEEFCKENQTEETPQKNESLPF